MKTFSIKNIKTGKYILYCWTRTSQFTEAYCKNLSIGSGLLSEVQMRNYIDDLILHYGKEKFNELFKVELYTIVKNDEYNTKVIINNAEKRVMVRKLKYG